jgi:hypothetical protein
LKVLGPSKRQYREIAFASLTVSRRPFASFLMPAVQTAIAVAGPPHSLEPCDPLAQARAQ